MFIKRIRDLMLTSDVANTFFKIYGASYNEDKSFTATLRALLHRRAQDIPITFEVSGSRWSEREVASIEDTDLFADTTGHRFNPNTLRLQILNSDTQGNAAVFARYDDAEKGFVAHYPQYRELQDLKLFVQSKANTNARFYIDEQQHVTVILAEDISLRKYHFLQSLIPRYFPWFFENAPLNEQELALLTALTHRTATAYENIIEAIGNSFDLRSHVIKAIIGDFEKIGRRDEIQKTTNDIASIRNRVEEYMRRYTEALDTLDQLNLKLNGQQMALDAVSDNSELIDYFSSNKSIMPVQVNGRRLYFTVKTFFESFDPELYATYIKKETSFLYQGYNVPARFANYKVRRKMLDAIFSDKPLLKVKMCSNYIINLNGNADAIRHYDYDEASFRDYIPNPHIQYFACLGNYRSYIDRAIQEGNLVLAIEQCIASAKSLNLTEAHTTKYFLGELFNSNHNVIQLPDGRDVTPAEALDYLNSLEEKKEETHE